MHRIGDSSESRTTLRLSEGKKNGSARRLVWGVCGCRGVGGCRVEDEYMPLHGAGIQHGTLVDAEVSPQARILVIDR